jgi:hypothetical protein
MQQESLINAFGLPGTEDAFVAVAQVGQSSAGGTKSSSQVNTKYINPCSSCRVRGDRATGQPYLTHVLLLLLLLAGTGKRRQQLGEQHGSNGAGALQRHTDAYYTSASYRLL